MDTEVYIAWALHGSADGNSGLTTHTATGVFNMTKHNLIMEAMNAGKTTPAPTTKAGNEARSRVVAFAILPFTACVLSPGGVLQISSDGDDRRIFLGLKFSIPEFFGKENLADFFGHSKQSEY